MIAITSASTAQAEPPDDAADVLAALLALPDDEVDAALDALYLTREGEDDVA